jgi:antitoxin HicB
MLEFTGKHQLQEWLNMAKDFQFTVLFEPAEEGGYTVTVPALPGLVTEGKDITEARAMALEAIQCHIESLLKDGEPVPEDVQIDLEPIKERLDVSVGAA